MKLEDGQYTVVNQANMKGSSDQNPIGFVFDGAQDRPTKKELNQYQNSKGQAPSDNTLVQDTVLGDGVQSFAPENVDFDGSTNDEVKVDGINAAEAPLVSLEDIVKAQPQAGEQPAAKKIAMQPDNVNKILSGEKTTTLRTRSLCDGVCGNRRSVI